MHQERREKKFKSEILYRRAVKAKRGVVIFVCRMFAERNRSSVLVFLSLKEKNSITQQSHQNKRLFLFFTERE